MDVAVQERGRLSGQQGGGRRMAGGAADKRPGSCSGFGRVPGGVLTEPRIDPFPAQRLPPCEVTRGITAGSPTAPW
jgi:hypothetical protein